MNEFDKKILESEMLELQELEIARIRYNEIFKKSVRDKKGLMVFFRVKIKESLNKKFKNKDSIDFFCINNLIENIFFTIEHECLCLLQNGLNEALDSRMRKLFEQVNDIILLNYYSQKEKENELSIIELYYINFICKLENLYDTKNELNNQNIDARVKSIMDRWFSNIDASNEVIKKVESKIKKYLKINAFELNDFWFYDFVGEGNKRKINKKSICENLINEKLEKYFTNKSILETKENRSIKKSVEDFYKVYEINKNRGNFYVHSNISTSGYNKQYLKELKEMDKEGFDMYLQRINVLIFIFIICVFDEDKHLKEGVTYCLFK